jgi:hypothetical protein
LLDFATKSLINFLEKPYSNDAVLVTITLGPFLNSSKSNSEWIDFTY